MSFRIYYQRAYHGYDNDPDVEFLEADTEDELKAAIDDYIKGFVEASAVGNILVLYIKAV